MNQLFCIGPPLDLDPNFFQVEYFNHVAALIDRLSERAAAAVVLNYFDDPAGDLRILGGQVPFLRVFQIFEIADLEKEIKQEAAQERRDILKRLQSLINSTNSELVHELSQMFIAKYEFYNEQLKGDGLLFHAHNLKSSSSNLGALKLARLCQQIELSVHQSNVKTHAFIKAILSQYQQVIEILSDVLKSFPKS